MLRRLAPILCGLVSIGSATQAQVPARSLLLITIDTLRADYVGCNGSEHAPTPHLDSIAAEGVNFIRARSQVPLTLPSHASILTASTPPTHTVRDNGSYRLPDSQLTLAEVLSSHGYRSIAIVSSFVLDRRYGLGQGFEVYDDRVWSEVSEIENLESERSGGEAFESFRSWLQLVEREQRFFVWVHLYDPHAPYRPPERYRSRYSEDPYAGEVAYVDEIVGRMVQELSDSGRLDRTVVAVVGDHGEGLGDHGESTHSLLIYNSTLHVPMMIRAPGLVPSGRVVDRLVRSIDLAPTLLNILGIETEFGEGVSLMPLILEPTQSSTMEELASYSESMFGEINLGWAFLSGLETDKYRLIAGAEPELFDLELDPGETRNRIAQNPEIYASLTERLSQWSGESRPESPATSPVHDSAEMQRLRSLGYLSGSKTKSAGAASEGPIDPRQKLAVWNRLQEGISLYGLEDFQAAAMAFESVLRDDSGVTLAYEFLGSSYEEMGESEKAERVYERALSLGLDSAQIRLSLGKSYLQTGRTDAAVVELERSTALDPLSAEGHYYLGNAYRDAGDAARAVEQYRSAVGLNPSYLWAWNGLGMTLAGQGSQTEALQAFRRAVDIDPSAASGYFNLAAQLERMGAIDPAIEAYRRFLELAEDPDLAQQRQLATRALERLGS